MASPQAPINDPFIDELIPALPEPQPPRRMAALNCCAAILAAVYGGATIYSAWLCDDSYINLRTVQNFALGHGLRWNTVERVQAFTSPLWLLILALFHRLVYPSPGAVYHSTLLFSFAMSFAAAAILVFGVARGPRGRLIILAGLVGSKALIEYSSGGLENPLCHLSLAGFCAVWLSRRDSASRPFMLAISASMLSLARLDLSLIVAPALALELWERRDWRTVGFFVLGFVPLVAWEIFSVIYYGFPFPNTAYAKLSGTAGWLIRLRVGELYFLNSVRWDYPTLGMIMIAIAIAIDSPERRRGAIAAGIALYLVYILRIGGDFMSGRLFAAPAIAALALLGRWNGRFAGRRRAKMFIVAALLGLALPYHPLHTALRSNWPPPGVRDLFQIADERSWYYPGTTLFHDVPGSPPPRHGWADEGRRDRLERGDAWHLIVTGTIGYIGFFAGPNAHIVDRYALSDPLLARISPRTDLFRAGHLERNIPLGYLETLRTGENVIKDPQIARLYDDLVLVTRGPLWTRARWRAILRLNLGR